MVVTLAGAAITAGLIGLSVQSLPEQYPETTANDIPLAATIRQRVQSAAAAGAGVGCPVVAGAVAALPPDSGVEGQVSAVMLYLAAATALSLLRAVGEIPVRRSRDRLAQAETEAPPAPTSVGPDAPP
ncbi:MAG: hypothetical protein F4X18_10330 [Acidimicrobiia bacterium]|nr:hypothetical protein [Acidimicrobiia bacterium]